MWVNANDIHKTSGGTSVGSEIKKKSDKEIAQEVLSGKWGNGSERKRRLTEASYDYNAIQSIINKLM